MQAWKRLRQPPGHSRPFGPRVAPVVDLARPLVGLVRRRRPRTRRWDWCCDLVRRLVAGPTTTRADASSTTRSRASTATAAPTSTSSPPCSARSTGAPRRVLELVAGGRNRHRDRHPRVEALDVPPPSHKGRRPGRRTRRGGARLRPPRRVPGGGYLVILDPGRRRRPGRSDLGDVRFVPFTYVRAYAIALQSARIDGGLLATVDPTDPEPDGDPLPELPDRPVAAPRRRADRPQGTLCRSPRVVHAAVLLGERDGHGPGEGDLLPLRGARALPRPGRSNEPSPTACGAASSSSTARSSR